METLNGSISGIVFDLDGTLYVSHQFASAIQDSAARYVAALQGVTFDEACRIMLLAREELEQEAGFVPPLSSVCAALGGNIRDLHEAFSNTLRPETFLMRDERVINLMKSLAERYSLHIYTNNNRALTARITAYLGLNSCFERIFAIDDTWRAKPDDGMLDMVLAETGLIPEEALFVGDRYDIDLRLPEQRGCPVYLSQTIEQLLRLQALL